MSGPEVAQLLAGRRGLILGVSGPDSVGYHAALAFRAFGAEVAVSVRPSRGGLHAELSEKHGLTVVELEASDERSVERAVERAATELGGLDFFAHTLVHVPDGVLGRPVTELRAEELAEVMEVGVRSLLVAARFALPWLERSDAARIVTLLSGGADFAMPSYHAVGIAKAALGAASRYLAAELGPKGVLVNAVSFSIIETAAARRVIGEEQTRQSKAYIAKRSLTRRELSFDDVTRAMAYLCSPMCSNLTAEVLNVDGGFTRSYFR